MPDTTGEVYRSLRQIQNKHTYFLLAAAGAAIAFALSKTQSSMLDMYQIPLALGILCWGLSFFCGCRYVDYVSSHLYSNAMLLQVERGQHPVAGTQSQMIAAASAGIRDAMESNSEKANRLGHWQFRFLIAGAVFYILWHVFEMYLRGVT